MSEKEEQNEDMNAFEAELGSLRPRTDRLDPGWRSLLSEKLADTRRLCFGITSTGDAPCSSKSQLATDVMLKHKLRDCSNPAGHEFFCIHCGGTAPTASRARRWDWPTAFSTMTAVAATLLVMLACHWLSQCRPASPQVAAVVEEPSTVRPDDSFAITERPATALAGRSAAFLPAGGANEMSYLFVRNQVLRGGVESWKSPDSTLAVGGRAEEAPLSYREQLDRLLKETNHAG
jgi:hypothetical protein